MSDGLDDLNAAAFGQWLEELDTAVIQGDYGYERGEFTVFPEHWRCLFDEGLTPQQAFRRLADPLGWAPLPGTV